MDVREVIAFGCYVVASIITVGVGIAEQNVALLVGGFIQYCGSIVYFIFMR